MAGEPMWLDGTEGGEPTSWLCRFLPGEHIGGPACWCVPLVFRPFAHGEIERMEAAFSGGREGALGAGGVS